LIQGKLPKKLEKFIQNSVISQEVQDVIAVQDKKLGKAITEKFGVKCVSTDLTEQLFRGIRL
jgi:nucleolar protein 58